jgi:hypothetical protein
MARESRSAEFYAIPVVLVILGVIFGLMIAADLGAWAWVVFWAVLVVIAVAAIAVAARRRRHPPALDAPSTGMRRTTSADDSYRVLVVADESLTAQAFTREITPHAAGRPVEVLVVAPALRSRLAHWTGDDSQRDRAETHLAETVDALVTAGVRARGEIGSDDPIQAADDALRTFEAAEVVFVTGGGDRNWLERDVLDVALERYDVLVTHIPADDSRS